ADHWFSSGGRCGHHTGQRLATVQLERDGTAPATCAGRASQRFLALYTGNYSDHAGLSAAPSALAVEQGRGTYRPARTPAAPSCYRRGYRRRLLGAASPATGRDPRWAAPGYNSCTYPHSGRVARATGPAA